MNPIRIDDSTRSALFDARDVLAGARGALTEPYANAIKSARERLRTAFVPPNLAALPALWLAGLPMPRPAKRPVPPPVRRCRTAETPVIEKRPTESVGALSDPVFAERMLRVLARCKPVGSIT